MSNGAIAGAEGAAGYYITANALKASGAIVRVEPNVFEQFIQKEKEPLVVFSESSFLFSSYKYLTNYKGIFFFTKTKTPLILPGKAEIVKAKSIWIPN
jgi:hypothetical protein